MSSNFEQCMEETAEALKNCDPERRGLTIWSIANDYGVDHHEVARALNARKNARYGQERKDKTMSPVVGKNNMRLNMTAIKQLAESKGLTLQELSLMTGTDDGYLTDYMHTPNVKARASKYMAIANVLGCKPEDIVLRDGEQIRMVIGATKAQEAQVEDTPQSDTGKSHIEYGMELLEWLENEVRGMRSNKTEELAVFVAGMTGDDKMPGLTAYVGEIKGYTKALDLIDCMIRDLYVQKDEKAMQA